MTPEQVQQILDGLMFLSGVCLSVVVAVTWRG